MNVALYLRYSSDKQTEQSIEGQRRICQQYCENNGYNIVCEYIDRAHSAYKDIEKRTEFQQMIKDSAKTLFDAVVVYKLDRFSRNRYESATYKAKLKRNGVSVISATENISDNPEGILLSSMLEGLAEYYSAELSQKVSRGMNETALKCNSTGGTIPLGYKIENKKYVIDEATAPIVREAFDLYANGFTMKAICDLFNERGYRTAIGKPFNRSSFHRMFANEKYIGIYKYNDVIIEDGVPRIIDDETFNVVSEKMRENKKSPARSKASVEYLLSGKVICGHCNSMMIGDCGTGESGLKYYYYSCGGKKNRHNGCDKKAIRKEDLEDAVAENAMSILTDDMIEHMADLVVAQNEADINNNEEANAIRELIEDTNKRMNNLMKSLEMGVTATEVTDRINELSRVRQSYEKQLSLAEAKVIRIPRKSVVAWLNSFKNGDINDIEFRRALFDLLVNSVTVWDTPDGFKITVAYNVKKDNKRVFKIPSKISSDIEACGSPSAHKPNIIVFDTLILVTTAHNA